MGGSSEDSATAENSEVQSAPSPDPSGSQGGPSPAALLPPSLLLPGAQGLNGFFLEFD